jgi:hypothetical protein
LMLDGAWRDPIVFLSVIPAKAGIQFPKAE